jgi:uncharacterized membrane protein YccC
MYLAASQGSLGRYNTSAGFEHLHVGGLRLYWGIMTVNPKPSSSSWWDLHLRRARGATLTEEEQEKYDAEITRQDRDDKLPQNLENLKRLRAEVWRSAQENVQLRARVAALENEIRSVERSLSKQTREVLGVAE